MQDPVMQQPVPAQPEQLIRLRTGISKADYVGANRLYLRARNRWVRVFSVVFSVLILFFLLIDLVGSGGVAPEQLFFALLLLLCLLFPLLQKTAMTVSAGKMYEKNPYLHAEMSYWLFQDRIEENNLQNHTVFFWSELEGAAETEELLLLWHGMQIILIPAHAVNASAAAYLHNLLAQRLGKRFRFFAPLAACGMLSPPAEEEPSSPLHTALAAAAETPPSPQCFPPFSVSVRRRMPLRLSGIIPAAAITAFADGILSYFLASRESVGFEWRLFAVYLLLFGAFFAGVLALAYWVTLRMVFDNETNMRVVLLPCGFGCDTGRADSLFPWERVSVRDTGRAFDIVSDDMPGQQIKILRKDLSEENAEELRRLLTRCCGNRYAGKNGIVPR